ncbi:MAG TPA: HAD family hydrolase [Phycisphaerae bacterium]|nr:HAD family hydrolase [Phycisphaerae bacterium]HPS52197.1 HAD family hydrolase [Phycisphaerae bacterium]
MLETGVKTSKYDGVIFDMDGTLVESSLDFDVLRRELEMSPGRGILEQINEMPPSRQSTAHSKLLEFELAGARNAILNDGAEEILNELLSRRIPIALLTRNTRQSFEIVSKKFPIMKNFDIVMCREDGVIKPEPDGIILACRKMGIVPQKTLCVGDFEFDMLAARAAGAIGVLLTTHPNWKNYADKADYIINDLPALLNIFDSRD